MTAGFFQAILQFSNMHVGENLEAISLSDSMFYFSAKDNFTFIIRIEKSSPKSQKEIMIMLNLLSQRFFEMFPSAANWEGNLSLFEDFAPTCEGIFQIQAVPTDISPSHDTFPEQDLVPISTVIIKEASQKLCAIVDSGNANLQTKKYRKAFDDYESAIEFITLMPELEPHYPDLKAHLISQMKTIETLMRQESS